MEKEIKRCASFRLPEWMLDKLREGKEAGRGSQRKQLQDAFEAMYCADDKSVITDTDRIDWLADPNNTIGNVQLPRNVVIGNLASLRAAIDEAMELSKSDE